MELFEPFRVGYVVKMYPRFSETFIVNEMLAHQAAGLDFEIFSLRPSMDGRFHEALARVQAPVTYMEKPGRSHGAKALWKAIRDSAGELPFLWQALEDASDQSVNDVFQALLLARKVCARRITHLHAHFASTATSVARLTARFAGITYSFTAHAKDIYHENVDREDLRRKLRDATAVVTVSDYNKLFLETEFGSEAAGKVQRVYNGLDLSLFKYRPPVERPRRILAVGRLVEKKGFQYLIDACGILASPGCEFECEIVGAGTLEGDLRARVARLGVEERVRLLGPLSQGEVIRHMQEATVIAAPCVLAGDGDRDGLPTVLLEAMALGTPCVSTDVTGIPEILHDGETGLMAPQHDAAALAMALERLLNEQGLRERLARAARTLIEAKFNLHRNAARMRELLHSTSRATALVAKEVCA